MSINLSNSSKEIERKFIVHQSDFLELKNHTKVKRKNVIQFYLYSNDPEVERRIRTVYTVDSDFVYYYTEKRAVSNDNQISRFEEENIIEGSRFIELLFEIDDNLQPILKKRFTFTFENQFFELDIFNFEKEYALLEIELESEDSEISLPFEFKNSFEVTNNPNFKNSQIAKNGKFIFN